MRQCKCKSIQIVSLLSELAVSTFSLNTPYLTSEIPMPTSLPRRTFLMTVAATSGVFAAHAQAQAGLVDEKSDQAKGLGYVTDAKGVDKKKYPKFAADQKCASCALFQGKAGDKAGACPLFAGKQVAAAGWCSAWAKKAA